MFFNGKCTRTLTLVGRQYMDYLTGIISFFLFKLNKLNCVFFCSLSKEMNRFFVTFLFWTDLVGFFLGFNKKITIWPSFNKEPEDPIYICFFAIIWYLSPHDDFTFIIQDSLIDLWRSFKRLYKNMFLWPWDKQQPTTHWNLRLILQKSKRSTD